MENTFVIGITGGIGSGKSTISTILEKKYDVTFISADIVNRDITKKASVVKKISEKFGKEIVFNNQINKAKLRELITECKDSKKWLEEYLHPAINKEIKKQVMASTTPFTLVEIPLLAPHNKHNYSYLNKIIVVKADSEVRIQRIIKRDNKNRQQAVALMNLQISDELREMIADYVIDTTDINSEDLNSKIEDVFNEFITLTKAS